MNVFLNPISVTDQIESIEIDSRQNPVQYGDVFFTASSETPEEVGMTSVWLERIENTYLNSFCFGFRPCVVFDPYYLAYMFRSNSVRQQIVIGAQGISRFNISKSRTMQITISVPEMQEQKRLGKLFKNLDDLITLYQRKLETEQQRKKSLMKLLLTGIVRVR